LNTKQADFQLVVPFSKHTAASIQPLRRQLAVLRNRR
jgi:hypothetical protein